MEALIQINGHRHRCGDNPHWKGISRAEPLCSLIRFRLPWSFGSI